MMIKIDSIKKKLMVLSLVPFMLMSAIVIGVLVFNNTIIRQHKEILEHLYFYHTLSTSFRELDSSLSGILPSSYSTKEIDEDLKQLDKLITSLDPYIDSSRGTSSWASVKGLGNMFLTYREHNEAIKVLLKQGSSYYEEFSYTRTVAEFIKKRIDTLVSEYLRESRGLYDQIRESSDHLRTILSGTFIVFLFGLLFFIIKFGYSISRPIKNLSEKVKRVANGEMDLPDEVVETHDEIAVLAQSFNEMVQKIRLLINRIVEQSELEKKLKEEEMRNLNNINFIREAEIKNLKAQINPHFLFNTLNTISKMALIENAPATNSLIQSTSQLLRYNLRKEGTEKVQLFHEIDNVREYMKIYQIRFQDKFTYRIDAPDQYMGIEVPFLVLQPLVENAIIHGIEPKSGKSILTISIHEAVVETETFVAVEVIDDGIGISEKAVKNFNEGKTTGLGLNNVKKRIEYFYGRTNLLSVHKGDRGGTRVQVLLPYSPKTQRDTNNSMRENLLARSTCIQ